MKMVLVSIIFLSINANLCAQDPEYNKQIADFGYSAVESAILNSQCRSTSVVNVDGLIILLAGIDTDESRSLLVKLTNYYLGSSTVEALIYAITNQQTKILANLNSELNRLDVCEGTEPKKCTCHTVQEKKALIERLTKLIEAGEKVDYVM